MRYSRRELANALQFFFLQIDSLSLFLVLDFGAGSKPVRDLPGIAAEGDGAYQVPPVAAVRGPFQAMFNLKYGTGPPGLFPGCKGPLPVLRMEYGIPSQVSGLFDAQPRVVTPSLVRILHAACAVSHPDHLRNRLEQRLILPPVSLQRGSLLVDTMLQLKSLDGVHHGKRQNVGRHPFFRQVVHCSTFHRIDGQFFAAERGEHDDSAGKAAVLTAELRKNLEAIHIRQVEIQQDTIGNPCPGRFDPGGSGIGFRKDQIGRQRNLAGTACRFRGPSARLR